ncbi:MAG: RelB/DinJ family addiction module antitoxin [Lachnospiraceae bacterium]|nr:RelB/DinJ family addiction module antitoxin [Lachnospiraceae bacterium]
MAEQVLNQFRSDKALREECVAIYEAMGMDLNTAFRMFMERTRMVRGLPFPAVLPSGKMTRKEAQAVIDEMRQEAADMPEMTLDEINAEIQAVRAEKRAKK